MQVKITPESTRTLNPIFIEVETSSPPVEAKVNGLGKVKLEKRGEVYKGSFWLQEAGNFEVSIKDSKDQYSQTVRIEQQEYLDFTSEFGFFLLLFFPLITGVFLWMHRLKKKSA